MVTGARARGIPEWRIMAGHGLPGALTPIVTMICLSIGSLLGGAAIVETIFDWPGIGSMVVDAIRVRDYPVIQGYVIWMAVIYLGVSLLRGYCLPAAGPAAQAQERGNSGCIKVKTKQPSGWNLFGDGTFIDWDCGLWFTARTL